MSSEQSTFILVFDTFREIVAFFVVVFPFVIKFICHEGGIKIIKGRTVEELLIEAKPQL